MNDKNQSILEQVSSAIKQSIIDFKNWDEHENRGGFSVNVSCVNDGDFEAECEFSDDFQKTILIFEGTDNDTVGLLYRLDEKTIEKMAYIMLEEKFITDYKDSKQ